MMSLYNELLESEVFFIIGPCVLDTLDNARAMAEKMVELREKHKVPFIFKASFDKANRQSIDSYRGLDFDESKTIFKKIIKDYDLPVLTDIHEKHQADMVDFAQVIQIPAFLCRQTDLLIAAGKSRAIVNIKKGQFMSAQQMSDSIEKVYSTGNRKVIVTERGTFFGYGDLVVDFRNIKRMRDLNVPVVFDATHSVQRPGSGGRCSDGDREFIKPLACASLEFGAKGIFMEVHPNPDEALCDGANSLDLDMLGIVTDEIMKRIRGGCNV